MAHVRDKWHDTTADGKKVRNDRGGKRWLAVYADPSGKARSKAFAVKVDAEKFLTTTDSDKDRGSWVDPRLSKITITDWAVTSKATLGHLKPSTKYGYLGTLEHLVIPRWGDTPLNRIAYSEVAGWVAELRVTESRRGKPMSASRTRHAFRVLSLMLDLAVKDGRLARNPCLGVKLPKSPTSDRRYLSHDQLNELADMCTNYQPLVLTLGYCGIRWGEATGLRVRRLDLLRGKINVTENAVEVGGAYEWGTPKSHESRTVPVPPFLRPMLAALCEGKGPDDPVFTAPRGGLLRYRSFRRDEFNNAATEVGLDKLTPHELRHTAASLAISSGANVKVVQQMLGHASAAMTLDLYAHLFADDLDAVATRLDEARTASLTDQPRTRAKKAVCQLPSAKASQVLAVQQK
jgi:integrase